MFLHIKLIKQEEKKTKKYMTGSQHNKIKFFFCKLIASHQTIMIQYKHNR